MLKNLTVLIVDDEPMQRKIAGGLLRAIGVGSVVECDDGGPALDMLAAPGHDIDLVICDLEMPNMDGLEFTRRLSEYDDPPALILNSSHKPAIIESVERMGRAYGLQVLGSFQKPLSRAMLEPLLQSAVLREAAAEAGIASENTEIDLRQCLEEHRFLPYFQPKLRFSDGMITAGEVLIRMHAPDGSILEPRSFMPAIFAEDLITEVTLELFEITLKILRDWKQAGYTPHISFNLSHERDRKSVV